MLTSEQVNKHIPGREKGYFKPGQSGNPGGRPRTSEFAAEVRAYLREKVKGKERMRLLLENLMKRRPEILLYYAYGKPIETVVQFSSQDEIDMQVSVGLARLLAQGKIMWTELGKKEFGVRDG